MGSSNNQEAYLIDVFLRVSGSLSTPCSFISSLVSGVLVQSHKEQKHPCFCGTRPNSTCCIVSSLLFLLFSHGQQLQRVHRDCSICWQHLTIKVSIIPAKAIIPPSVISPICTITYC